MSLRENLVSSLEHPIVMEVKRYCHECTALAELVTDSAVDFKRLLRKSVTLFAISL